MIVGHLYLLSWYFVVLADWRIWTWSTSVFQSGETIWWAAEGRASLSWFSMRECPNLLWFISEGANLTAVLDELRSFLSGFFIPLISCPSRFINTQKLFQNLGQWGRRKRWAGDERGQPLLFLYHPQLAASRFFHLPHWPRAWYRIAKRELGQYPAMLTSHLVNTHIYCGAWYSVDVRNYMCFYGDW